MWAAPDAPVPAETSTEQPPPATRVRTRTAPPAPVVTAGSVPLRPLNLGDVLDGTFATIHRNPRAMLGLSALLVTAGELLSLGIQVLAGEVPGGTFTFDDESFSIGIGGIFGLVIRAIFGAILTGMIVVVVSEDVLGRRTTALDVWRRVRPRIWALLVAAILAGAVPYIALLLLVVPGAFLWGAWALTTPALVLEQLGPFRALRRSWRLAVPAFWRVWGIRALSVLLGNVIELAMVLPFALGSTLLMDALGDSDADQLPLYALAILSLGAIVAGTLVQPFYAGVLALLYVDRRMRAEGFDISIQLGNRDARGRNR